MLGLMGGKATVDQIARRLGVHASTVEGWRQDALAGMGEALRRGSGQTARELEFEKENRQLRQVVTAYSGLAWAPIPAAPGHGFRNDAGADSGGTWALIPA